MGGWEERNINMLKINRIELVGNLTDDPAFRDMGEFQYASFFLAVDRMAEQNDGQTADFIPIVCKNDLAVSAEKYLRKGRRVYLEGRLHVRSVRP
jgi:single stranded DNA-binding protein